jgi:transposase
MPARFTVGIDVALHTHRIAVLGPDGEACGPSFTIAATADGVAHLRATLQAHGAQPAQMIVGLEATGHMWENLEAALTATGHHVVVLNPLQTRRFRDVLRRKAKTDDIDAHVSASVLRSGAATACYLPVFDLGFDERVR